MDAAATVAVVCWEGSVLWVACAGSQGKMCGPRLGLRENGTRDARRELRSSFSSSVSRCRLCRIFTCCIMTRGWRAHCSARPWARSVPRPRAYPIHHAALSQQCAGPGVAASPEPIGPGRSSLRLLTSSPSSDGTETSAEQALPIQIGPPGRERRGQVIARPQIRQGSVQRLSGIDGRQCQACTSIRVMRIGRILIANEGLTRATDWRCFPDADLGIG